MCLFLSFLFKKITHLIHFKLSIDLIKYMHIVYVSIQHSTRFMQCQLWFHLSILHRYLHCTENMEQLKKLHYYGFI